MDPLAPTPFELVLLVSQVAALALVVWLVLEVRRGRLPASTALVGSLLALFVPVLGPLVVAAGAVVRARRDPRRVADPASA